MDILEVLTGAAGLWALAAAALFIVEALTLGLTSVWFGVGAVAASVTAILGGEVLLQTALFLAVSVALIAVTRPLAVRFVNRKTEKTNICSMTGKNAVVTRRIRPEAPGAVKADGKVWTAVCSEEAGPGEIVTVAGVEGVKLIVEKKKDM